LFWNQTGESQVFGPEVLKDAEKQVQMVRESLKVAQSRQKSYADKRRGDLSFEIGDFVYLKVSHGLVYPSFSPFPSTISLFSSTTTPLGQNGGALDTWAGHPTTILGRPATPWLSYKRVAKGSLPLHPTSL
jgi:hypothetical protein